MQYDAGKAAMDNRKSIQKITYYGFLLVKKNNGIICGRYPVTKKECTIGRDTNCDLRILLDHVSAQHCIITYVDDKAYIRDKSIAGTTTVNGKKVGRSNFLLNQSDEIEVAGRKFEWLYARESNCSSEKKSAMKLNCMTPRSSPRVSYQPITPLVPQDNNKISQTPVKSNMKTLVSFNKTPIVLAAANMSKLSFEEVKESLKNQNSNVHSQSEPRLTKSYSMVSGRNIPLIGNSTLTPRKSWVITDIEDVSSGVNNLNKLSSERSKLDSTPEYDNTSYHYEDENVEFDSPVQPFISSNDEYSVNVMNTTDETYNLSILNPSDSIDAHSQSNNLQNLNLSDSECEPQSSRRNTYSVDGPIVIEQNTTPAPRRSILKCSKSTVKPNRSRSSCRMVQFARLPRSDSRIKVLKSRFNSGPNFVITDDEINNIDISQDSRKVELEAVEFDDDLDGVRPLDSSVSSLINSPILENPVLNKSSKRGSSRGNKVMSLISSFEKRTTESPKHSIRASDLLTLSGLKHGDTSLNNDLQNNTQESVGSARRVNLENIFEAEDSLKNLENEMTSKINENSLYIKDITSSAKKNLSYTNSEKVINDTQNKDLSENIDFEYNSASPLNRSPEINATVKVTEKNQGGNEVKNLSIRELNNISDLNNINTHKDEENRDEDIYTDHVKTSDESPSLIVQCVSDMFNKLLETTNSQNNIDTTQLCVMVEKDDIEHSKKSNEFNYLNQSTNDDKFNRFEEIVSRKSTLAALTNDDRISAIMDNVEARLSEVHGYPNSNSNKTVFADSISKKNNEKSIASDYNLQDTVLDHTFSDTDTAFIKSSVKKSSTLLTDSKSIHDALDESTVFSDISSNTKEETNSQNLSQKKMSNLNNSKHTITKKNSEQKILKKIQVLDISSESDSYGLESNENMGKTLNNSERSLNNSKHKITRKNSEQLNKSNLSKQSMVEHGKTRNSKKIQVLDIPSESHSEDLESNENMGKTLTNTEQLLSNSKHTTAKKNSEQLNKSNLSDQSTVEHGKTHSSKKVQVLVISSESDSDGLESNENMGKTLNNSERSLNNSKHKITRKNSEQLNKSNLSKQSMVEHGKTRSSKKIQVLDIPSESHSEDLEINENMGKTLTNSEQLLSNSKHTTAKKNSEQLNKSNLSDQSTVEHGKTRSSKKIQVLDMPSEMSHSDDFESNENVSKTLNNSEQSFNATIGIPQFESTPWNCSRSSKVTYNSTSCVNANETTHCVDSESGDILEENTPPDILFPEDIEIWSQMMKDFNESVKKASFTQSNVIDVSTVNRDLFNQEPISTENKLSLNYTSIANNSSKVEKNNTLQCSKISSCLPDNNTLKMVKKNLARKSSKSNRKSSVKAENSKQHVENENNTSKSSIHDISPNKNGSICIKTTNKINKQSGKNNALNNKNSDVLKENITYGTSSNTDSDSSLTKPQRGSKILKKNTRKTNYSLSLPSTRRNLRARVNKNESGKSIKKHVRINVPDETSENCDTDNNMNSSGSENASIPVKKLRLRNVKTTVKSTNNHTTIEQKNSQIVEKTSVKIKPVTEKSKKIALAIKTRSTRSNKTLTETNNILKLVKKSKSPIKTKSARAEKVIETKKSNRSRSTRCTKVSTSDSLENESMNETKKSLQKSQISDLPKINKGKFKKKDVPVDNTSSNPTKYSLKEKICETYLNVSPQIKTRGRKRTADTPISAPDAKGSKYNHLSKVTDTTVSRILNSPQSIRRTRNTSKSTNNSFPESTVDSTKEKPKLTRSTRANKRINSDDSSNDSLPFDRKKARKTIASSITIRDADNKEPKNAKKRLNKNVVKESISTKPTKTTRNTKQQLVPEVNESPAPRILRLRQKKQ